MEIELTVNVRDFDCLLDSVGAELICSDNIARTGTIKFLLPVDGRYEFEIQTRCRHGGDHQLDAWEFNNVVGTFMPDN